MRQELRAAPLSAREIRTGVIGPHAEHQEQDPAPLRAERVEGCGLRQRRDGISKPDHEAQLGHVETAEDGRDPRRQAGARILDREGADADDRQADRGQEHAAAAQFRRRCRVDDNGNGEHDSEKRQHRVARRSKEVERLDRAQDDDRQDRERQ